MCVLFSINNSAAEYKCLKNAIVQLLKFFFFLLKQMTSRIAMHLPFCYMRQILKNTDDYYSVRALIHPYFHYFIRCHWTKIKRSKKQIQSNSFIAASSLNPNNICIFGKVKRNMNKRWSVSTWCFQVTNLPVATCAVRECS